MNRETALNELTDDNIAITTNVLAALDLLQNELYVEKYEAKVRKITPHSESTSLEIGKQTILDFQTGSLHANGAGLCAFTSTFANGFLVLGMERESNLVMTITNGLVQ